jgi:hypothetical protein
MSKVNISKVIISIIIVPLLHFGFIYRYMALLFTIEIGLEHTPFVVLVIFFSSFEYAKNLLLMGPNNTKNSSLKCDFLIFNYE